MKNAASTPVEFIRKKLLTAVDTNAPPIEAQGKLLRPQVACAVATSLSPQLLEEDAFWSATLGLQMAHEASLIHDDLLDNASTRRGRPTLVATHGPSTALVHGDHLLTACYSQIAKTQHPQLFQTISQAIEETVVGEIAQAKSAQKNISLNAHLSILEQKTGALFGAAATIAPSLLNSPQTPQWLALGRQLGRLYQLLDDLLDYCPHAATGKDAFLDYQQQKPTWPWLLLSTPSWHHSPNELPALLFTTSHVNTLKDFFVAQCETLCHAFSRDVDADTSWFIQLIETWKENGLQAIALEIEHHTPSTTHVPSAAHTLSPEKNTLFAMLKEQGLDRQTTWNDYFAHHSRSFSFASRFFPPQQKEQVCGVYAYARFTDDLADNHPELSPQTRKDLLLEWRELSRLAHRGQSTGIDLLDHVLTEMGQKEVPFQYAHDLIEGMCHDLEEHTFQTLQELEHYCYCVASTIGLWLTELFGVHHPWVLERARSLGKAMQLTNILRDVGEDLSRGRIYLPLDLLSEYGLDAPTLHSLADRPLMPESYRELLEQLMALADKHYRLAYIAIPALPDFFQRPVAIAAHVYRGIQDELRKNQYDNFHHRAHTSLPRKIWLALQAFRHLKQAQSQHHIEFHIYEQTKQLPTSYPLHNQQTAK